MGGGNVKQGGTAFRGRHSDHWYYDQLPAVAREALANAAFEWSSGALFTRWRRKIPGYKTGEEIAARVAEWDGAIRKKKNRRRPR